MNSDIARPDYDACAALAAEVLIRCGITHTPVHPEEIIPLCPNTKLISYKELAQFNKMSRDALMERLANFDDALLMCRNLPSGKHLWIIAYNQQKPFDRIRFSLAHELGHRLREHIGFREDWVREEEADHFARHLLFPRALLAECYSRGMPSIDSNYYNITKCTEECLRRIQSAKPSVVDPEINRELRKRMTPHVSAMYNSGAIWAVPDKHSQLVSLETYMTGYRE